MIAYTLYRIQGIAQQQSRAMKQGRSSTASAKRRVKASSGTPAATKESAFILTPNTLGKMLVADLVLKKGPHIPGVLHALVHVAGASRANVAKMTGLTRGRIGHYLHLYEPVPEDRERQFYEILRDITEGYEENLTMFEAEFFHVEMDMDVVPVPEAVPVAREIIRACRKALAGYEAAHQPKDDADEGEVA